MRCWMVCGLLVWSLLAQAGGPHNTRAQDDPSALNIPRQNAQVVSTTTPSSLQDWRQAQDYFTGRQYYQALARVERHLSQHPGDCNGAYLKVHILLQLGETSEAQFHAHQLMQETTLLYPDWVTFLEEVVDQAQHNARNTQAANHYPPATLPWEA